MIVKEGLYPDEEDYTLKDIKRPPFEIATPI
jgi:hypothetical protein